jgi:hypothetical protein
MNEDFVDSSSDEQINNDTISSFYCNYMNWEWKQNFPTLMNINLNGFTNVNDNFNKDSCLSRFEYLVGVLNFYSNNHLSKAALNMYHQFEKKKNPSSFDFPTDAESFLNKFKFPKIYTYCYCAYCKNIFNYFNTECPICKKRVQVFHTRSIKDSISYLAETIGLDSLIDLLTSKNKKFNFGDDVIDDVFNSRVYERLLSKHKREHDIMVTIDVLFDGGEKWLNSSIWIGNATINEFPKELRCSIEYSLFLFFSEKKIPLSILLKPLMIELLELRNGFTLGNKTIKVFLFSPLADKMAIYELLNMVPPKSFFSCNSCYARGTHGSLRYLSCEDSSPSRTLETWKIDLLILEGTLHVSN